MLIRAAHSANIKERRDASCALFDPAGRMVMQAEHIPVHLGAMPAAVEAVAGERHEPGVLVGAERPVPRRHPPARHHGDHARVRPGGCAARLRREPRAPRRRRRADPRLDARRLDDARGRGRRDPAAPARRRRDRRARRPDAPARPAPRRPARAAGREPDRRAAAVRAGRARRPAGGDGGDDRLRRAAHARVPRRAARRDAHRARRARGGRGRPRAAARGDRGRRRAHARLQRLRRAARRQPELPALGHPLRLLVRRARPDRPRHPADRRRLPAGHRDRSPGQPAQRASRPPRSSPATSRRPRASRTSCSPHSAARSARAR